MSGRDQYRRMAAVTRRIYFLYIYNIMIELIHLLYEEIIHIGLRADGAIGASATQGSDNADTAKASIDLKSPSIEFLGENICSVFISMPSPGVCGCRAGWSATLQGKRKFARRVCLSECRS